MDTRSRSKARSAGGTSLTPQATPQGSTVSFRWVLCNPKAEQPRAYLMTVTRQQYEDLVQDCYPLFAAAILKYMEIRVRRSNLRLYKPVTELSQATVMEPGWGLSPSQQVATMVEMMPSLPLSEYVPKDAPRDNIQIVITIINDAQVAQSTTPVFSEEILPMHQRFYQTLSSLYQGPPPSKAAVSKEYAKVQADSRTAIFDGRYNTNRIVRTIAPPIQLFHPCFEMFTHMNVKRTIRPTYPLLLSVSRFMTTAGHISAEKDRAAYFRECVSEILGMSVTQQQNADGTCPDGTVAFDFEGVNVAVMILELTREFGKGGSDASIQASLSMKAYWRQNLLVAERCCCPTIMLVAGGPWLGVLGGVITDRVIVQRLTDLSWTANASTCEDPRLFLLSIFFESLKRTIQSLKESYSDFMAKPGLQNNIPHPRFFPYCTSFTEPDSNGRPVVRRFEYLDVLQEDSACITYRASLCDDTEQQLVVKFVAAYGQEVHRFLHEHDLAPRLRYFGELRDGGDCTGDFWPQVDGCACPGLYLGPLRMVVMDFIKSGPKPPDARAQIEAAMKLLHAKGFVFGDLRPPNVLFDTDGKLKLIDFDWSGRYNAKISDEDSAKEALEPSSGDDSFVRYPWNMNRSSGIPWADGAKDLMFIRPSHDLHMLSTWKA